MNREDQVSHTMDEAQYIEERRVHQIDWYGKKSIACQKRYKLLRSLEIVCAALIPFMVGPLLDKSDFSAIVAGALGVTVSIVAGLMILYKYQENWIKYRTTTESLKHEKILPIPMSPYAVQKLVGEYYCKAFYECYGLETMSLRYFNVFGDRQDPNSLYAAAIPAFVVAILHNQPPTIYGDGNQSRDFTHIQNVIDANMLAMNIKQAQGECINVACGSAITINQVIDWINRLLGTEVKPNYVKSRAGDVIHSCADITLAKKILGYKPEVSFEEGLKRAIEYYKSLG